MAHLYRLDILVQNMKARNSWDMHDNEASPYHLRYLPEALRSQILEFRTHLAASHLFIGEGYLNLSRYHFMQAYMFFRGMDSVALPKESYEAMKEDIGRTINNFTIKWPECPPIPPKLTSYSAQETYR